MKQHILNYLELLSQNRLRKWIVFSILLSMAVLISDPLIKFFTLIMTVYFTLDSKEELDAHLILSLGAAFWTLQLIRIGFSWFSLFPAIIMVGGVTAIRKTRSRLFGIDVSFLLLLSSIIVASMMSQQDVMQTILMRAKEGLKNPSEIPNNFVILNYWLLISISLLTVFLGAMFQSFKQDKGSIKQFFQEISAYKLSQFLLSCLVFTMIYFVFRFQTKWLDSDLIFHPMYTFFPLAFVGSTFVIRYVSSINIGWVRNILNCFTSLMLLVGVLAPFYYLTLALVGLVDYFFNMRLKLTQRGR